MDQFTAHLDRGWDLVSRGDYPGALLSAQKSLELNAESPEAHNLMGYVQAAEGNAEQALEHYRQAIDLDETFVEAMLNAAEVLMQPLADYEEALKLIEEALDYCETDDEIADAMLLKIDAYLSSGDRDAATRSVKALPDGPFENANLDFLIGRAKFEVGDIDGADARVKDAIARDPEHAEAHYYQGLVAESRGDIRGATVAFLKARELDLRNEPPPFTLPPDQFEQRVQQAIRKLPKELSAYLDGALVIATDAPGIEIVADGVDPRIGVLLDGFEGDKAPVRATRVFVYQRNIERASASPLDIEDEIARSLAREIEATFKEKLAEEARHLPVEVPEKAD